MKSKIASIMIIIPVFLVAIIRLVNNTESIVLNWDIYGNIANYGPAYLILFYPCISTLTYWIFRYYEQNPYKIKWLPKIKNYESKSKALATYIQSTNLLLLLIILYVTLCSTQLVHMRPLIIVLILLLMVVPYIYIYNKIRKSNSGTD